MHEFIHTYSIVTYLTESQIKSMACTYKHERDYNNEKIWFYNHTDKKLIFSKYADRGFRMEIEFTAAEAKRFDKKHREYKAQWIVTPSKLIHPGQPMMKLFNPDEYAESCVLLYSILEEIQSESGVDLLDEAKIRRVDIAKDIETPSDAYSREVIRIAKKALNKCGYRLKIPTQEEIQKKGWLAENSAMFSNHNQEVQSKIYNKLVDMKNNGYDTGDLSGLLRFELSLKRRFMKVQGFLSNDYLALDDLPVILKRVLNQAPELMQKHITTPFGNGAMLSKNLQKKYIRICCGEKKAKYEKMMAYRRKFNRKCGLDTADRNPTVERYFEEIGLSPLYTDDAVRYIPAFADFLAGTENEDIRNYIRRH